MDGNTSPPAPSPRFCRLLKMISIPKLKDTSKNFIRAVNNTIPTHSAHCPCCRRSSPKTPREKVSWIARDYTEVHPEEIDSLTQILSTRPPSEDQEEDLEVYRSRTLFKIRKLPSGLRASMPLFSPLCSLHDRISQYALQSILSALRRELDDRLFTVWMPLALENLLEPDLAADLTRLQNVIGLWTEPDVFRAMLARDPDPQYVFQQHKCVACLLCKIGSDPCTVMLIGAMVLGRFTRAPPGESLRVRWCEGWLRASFGVEETRRWIAKMHGHGDILRKVRQRRKEERKGERARRRIAAEGPLHIQRGSVVWSSEHIPGFRESQTWGGYLESEAETVVGRPLRYSRRQSVSPAAYYTPVNDTADEARRSCRKSPLATDYPSTYNTTAETMDPPTHQRPPPIDPYAPFHSSDNYSTQATDTPTLSFPKPSHHDEQVPSALRPRPFIHAPSPIEPIQPLPHIHMHTPPTHADKNPHTPQPEKANPNPNPNPSTGSLSPTPTPANDILLHALADEISTLTSSSVYSRPFDQGDRGVDRVLRTEGVFTLRPLPSLTPLRIPRERSFGTEVRESVLWGRRAERLEGDVDSGYGYMG